MTAETIKRALVSEAARRNMDLATFARRIGISQRQLGRRIKALDGQRSTLAFLAEAAQALGISLSELIKTAEEVQAAPDPPPIGFHTGGCEDGKVES